jgi:hypothetical protein
LTREVLNDMEAGEERSNYSGQVSHVKGVEKEDDSDRRREQGGIGEAIEMR